MIRVSELRKLIEGKPDDEEIPLYVRYGTIADDYIFLRTDKLEAGAPEDSDGAVNGERSKPGLILTASLVDTDADEEDDDEGSAEKDERGTILGLPIEGADHKP